MPRPSCASAAPRAPTRPAVFLDAAHRIYRITPAAVSRLLSRAMKKPLLRLAPFAVALLATPLVLPAQSDAASTHASRAVHASGTASAETVAAGAHAAAGSIRVVSAVAAVPLWLGGAALSTAGQVSLQVGHVSAQAGHHTTRAAADFWQTAATAPAPFVPAACTGPRRPPLDRTVGLPPRAAPAPTCDPSPAEAFRRHRSL